MVLCSPTSHLPLFFHLSGVDRLVSPLRIRFLPAPPLPLTVHTRSLIGFPLPRSLHPPIPSAPLQQPFQASLSPRPSIATLPPTGLLAPPVHSLISSQHSPPALFNTVLVCFFHPCTPSFKKRFAKWPPPFTVSIGSVTLPPRYCRSVRFS